MDEFWKSVKGKGQLGIECLKQLIVEEQQDGYFAFDAAALLLSLDQSSGSLDVALAGLAKTDLEDVDSSFYIRTTMFLYHKGLDITPLVERYMTASSVKGYVPQHALTLDRETGAIFMYGSMPVSLADQSLIRMLKSSAPGTRSAAVALLSLSMTPESFKALREIDMGSLPDPIKKSVEGTLKYMRPEDTNPSTKSRA